MLLSVTAAVAASADSAQWVQEDIHLSADKVFPSRVDGSDVTVASGKFRLTLGKSVVSGNDAVLWVTSHGSGDMAKREVTVYVEGKATVSEPDGTSLSDTSIIVHLRHEGRFFAPGKTPADAKAPKGLLKRAAATRANSAAPQTAPVSPAPLLIAAADAPVVPGGTIGTAAEGGREKKSSAAKSEDGTQNDKEKGKEKGEDEKKKKSSKQSSVMYHYNEIVAYKAEPGATERPLILRGDVYLAQGNRDSDLFMEFRCDRAVAFMAVEKKGDSSDAAAPGMGAMSGGGKIRSVYLEGNVVISQGKRTLRAKSAFYDYTTNRAVILNCVFRTIQEQRNIPMFVRSPEARLLSDREFWFRSAKFTTSDFYSPTYYIAASRVYLKDIAQYDQTGQRLGPEAWELKLLHSRMNVRGIPVWYWPYTHVKGELFHTALRRINVGNQGQNFGYGVETSWELFRMLGLTQPEGFEGRFDLSYYDRGWLAGVNVKYNRPTVAGYNMLYGLIDNRGRDDFGDNRQDLSVPNYRGRFTHRHKQFLPNNWQVQGEFSWYSDAGFPEMFFPSEFYAGKEQETLIYAKHQEDNRVFTALGQYRLNRFDTQTESMPDLAYYIIGEPVMDGQALLFSENRAGIKRWRPAKASTTAVRKDSRQFSRVDVRDEVNVPLHLGWLNVTPYATVRGSYWDDAPIGVGEKSRPYGQVGAKANFHIWRVYNDAESRLWDVHGLKHVVTPEAAVFTSDNGGVRASELYPIDPDVEQHLTRQSGATIGIRQRLLTKRGAPGQRESTDWMRWDVTAGTFRNTDTLPADGRYFAYRPEYSLARSYVNSDYLWNISDATTLLTDGNYDTHTGKAARANASLNVRRDPRLSYFAGVRYIGVLDSSVGTLGATYQLTRKYSATFFEQYDLDFAGGDNMSTRLGLVRRFPRWSLGLTVIFDQNGEGDDIGFFLSVWPEGMPEVKIGEGGRGFFTSSDLN